MSLWHQEIREREKALEAAWAEAHGPWNPRGTYPPHPKPPCVDCWYRRLYNESEPATVEGLSRASTLFDAHDGRYLVCEPCWLRRMRGAGWSDAEIRTILIEQGEFTPEDADAALALTP